MRPVILLPSRVNTFGMLPTYTTNAAYLEAVAAAGGMSLQLPLLEGTDPERAMALADGLLLTGGWDIDAPLFGEENHPTASGVCRADDEAEIALLRAALRRKKPVLGICRGIQIINVALGGTLWQDIPSQTASPVCHRMDYEDAAQRRTFAHPVRVEAGSRLHALLGGESQVNSFHHQCVKDLAPGLIATAWAPDGLVEGVETADGAIVAVQWHPEELSPYYPNQAALFADLIARCKREGEG